eukprot:XP_011683235.1 PREDICTED: sushi, von Willebrand factor type A, EGF and pentraxin domain-containing protein 1 isoform X2 [Strongylocentrotus purpuratus]
MEEKSVSLFSSVHRLFLCLLHSGGVSSSCDNINQIDFAEITYDEPEGLVPHPDGTVASIECGVFYQIVPTAFERTTCTDGSWTGPLPRCRHVPRYCQRNEDLVQINGRDCQTQCMNRLNGACPGNKQCHCDGVCGWSCISIYEDNFCPEVADQAGLLVTYDPPERRFNGFADFSCGDGYIYHSGSSRLLCMSNRQWGGGNEIVCIPNDNQNPVITCPTDFTSDTLTVSFLVYVTDNADPAPALTYDPLGPGSTFPLGPTTVTVTATDSSSNHDSCIFTVTVTDEDNFCPEVANQAGLLVTYDPPERRFNGFADFSCGDGYIYHSGSSRLLCMINRQWGGGNDFVCIPNDNQNPVITCPADFTSDTLTVSFLVYVTDNIDPAPALTYDPLGPGSTFPLGPTTVNVTATDSSSNHDSCTFTVTVTVPCGHPVRASRSTIEILPGVQGYVHDTRVRYSCSEGWEIEGTAERECDNGQWTGSTPVCRVAAHLRCMLPDHRSSGARYSITGFIGNVVEEGLPIGERVSISVRCNPGYRAQPAVQTACLKRGAWSVDVPICEPVPQPPPQPDEFSGESDWP